MRRARQTRIPAHPPWPGVCQRGEGFESLAYSTVMGRWSVQKRHCDLGEHMRGRPAGQPQSQLVGEAIRVWREHQEGATPRVAGPRQ
jgi:hypothetical protein